MRFSSDAQRRAVMSKFYRVSNRFSSQTVFKRSDGGIYSVDPRSVSHVRFSDNGSNSAIERNIRINNYFFKDTGGYDVAVRVLMDEYLQNHKYLSEIAWFKVTDDIKKHGISFAREKLLVDDEDYHNNSYRTYLAERLRKENPDGDYMDISFQKKIFPSKKRVDPHPGVFTEFESIEIGSDEDFRVNGFPSADYMFEDAINSFNINIKDSTRKKLKGLMERWINKYGFHRDFFVKSNSRARKDGEYDWRDQDWKTIGEMLDVAEDLDDEKIIKDMALEDTGQFTMIHLKAHAPKLFKKGETSAYEKMFLDRIDKRNKILDKMVDDTDVSEPLEPSGQTFLRLEAADDIQ